VCLLLTHLEGMEWSLEELRVLRFTLTLYDALLSVPGSSGSACGVSGSSSVL